MPFFTLEYTNEKYVLGLKEENWFWFFDYFIEHPTKINYPANGLDILFTIYLKEDALSKEINELPELDYDILINNKPEAGYIYFEESSNKFKFKNEEYERYATHKETLTYSDIITSQNINLFELKLRLLEHSQGLIPSYQNKIEYTYKHFFDNYIKQFDEVFFKPKERKKVFDELFNNKILPFVNNFGFTRHTKTSKRIIKNLSNDLNLVIYFDYISFGYGYYATNIVFYENKPDKIQHDEYLVSLKFNLPYHSNTVINCQNKQLLEQSIDYWIRIADLYLFQFIQKIITVESIKDIIKKHNLINSKREALGIEKMMQKPFYNFTFPNTSKKLQFIATLDSNKKKL